MLIEGNKRSELLLNTMVSREDSWSQKLLPSTNSRCITGPRFNVCFVPTTSAVLSAIRSLGRRLDFLRELHKLNGLLSTLMREEIACGRSCR